MTETITGYDSETTGIPIWKAPSGLPEQPHLVQLAAVKCDKKTGEIKDSLDVIIKPDGWIIPQETIDVHGITNEYALEHGIPEKDALNLFLDFCGDDERVAYNKTFDQRIIRIACKRYLTEDKIEKWAVKEDHYCAMQLARKAMPKKHPYALVDSYKYFTGEDFVGAHDAMNDTKACMKVYFEALKYL